jgi:hypothetical protein
MECSSNKKVVKVTPEISKYAKLFYDMIIRHVAFLQDFAQSFDKNHNEEICVNSITIVLRDFFHNGKNVAKVVGLYGKYPGDEMFILDSSINEKAPHNLLSVLAYKKMCEISDSPITYADYVMFKNMIMASIDNCKPDGKTYMYHIIKSFGIDDKYVPDDIKLYISKSVETHTADQIIDKFMDSVDNPNGITHTFESYSEYMKTQMSELAKVLQEKELFEMVSLDRAYLSAIAIKLGLYKSTSLYISPGNEVMPADMLKNLLESIWESAVSGGGEFDKKIIKARLNDDGSVEKEGCGGDCGNCESCSDDDKKPE